jgi:DNA-binding transcriptional LysR family regulator
MTQSEILSSFLVLAEEADLSRAARRCGITQRLLRERVASLEAQNGSRLCKVKAKAVRLTHAGKHLQRSMVPLSAETGSSRRIRIMQDPIADLSLSYWIGEFARQASLRLDFRIDSGRSPGGRDELGLNNIDMRLAYGGPAKPGGAFVWKTLFEDPIVVLLRNDHRLANLRCLQMDALREERWVLPSPRFMPYIYDTLIWACRRAGLFPRLARLEHKVPLVDAVLGGSAISLAPSGFLSHCPKEIVGVPLRPPVTIPFGAIYRAAEVRDCIHRFLGRVRLASRL